MKLYVCTFWAAALLSMQAFAQIDTVWTRILPEYEGGNYEITGSVGLPDGGFALCATIQTMTYDDNLIMRTNSGGELVWWHLFPYGEVESPWAILQADDGSFRVFGTQYSFSLPLSYIYMFAISANGDSLWTTYFEMNEVYGDLGATKLSDGNFVIVADTTIGDYYRDMMLFKVDPNGNLLRTRYYDYGEYDYGNKVIESADGTLLVAGRSANSTIGSFNIVLMRLDQQGNLLWDEVFNLDDVFGGFVTSLAENALGDIFVTAVMPGIWWYPTSVVVKYDAQGQYQWSEQTTADLGVELYGTAPDAIGGCIVAGRYVLDFNGYYTPVLYAYDNSGVLVDTWVNNELDWRFNGVCPALGGGHLAYGVANAEDIGYYTGYLVRIGAPTTISGQITGIGNNEPLEGVRVELSTGVHVLTDFNGYYSLVATNDTVDVLITGACITPLAVEDVVITEGEVNTRDFSVGIPEYDRTPSSINLAIRYDIETSEIVTLHNEGSGELTYTAEVHSVQPDYNWITVAPSQGTIQLGGSEQLTLTIFADSEQSSTTDFFAAVRVRNHSCPDSIDDVPVAAIALNTAPPPVGSVTKYALHPAYPNPFNAVTQLRFDLVSPGSTTLELYDIQGRLVRPLVSEYMPAGTHTMQLDMSDAASGLYLVRMHHENFNAVQKIILLK